MPELAPGESFDAGLTLTVHRGAAELAALEKTIGA
jgi:hypothetical protein